MLGSALALSVTLSLFTGSVSHDDSPTPKAIVSEPEVSRDAEALRRLASEPPEVAQTYKR